MKRLFREAYRKNKAPLYEKLQDKKLNVMFIYKSKTIVSYSEMEKMVVNAIQGLLKNVYNEI